MFCNNFRYKLKPFINPALRNTEPDFSKMSNPKGFSKPFEPALRRGSRPWKQIASAKPIVSIVLPALLFVAWSSACTPVIDPPGISIHRPFLTETFFSTTDGAKLSLRTWLPEGKPKIVLLALHGFNDYSNFFDAPAKFFQARGIASYAYDQRGFGNSSKQGTWGGINAYANDAADAVSALRNHYPTTPIFLLGASMGGAVGIVATTTSKPLPLNGVILSSPAIWGRLTMPWYQRLALWLGAHTAPWLKLSGRGLGIKPSDNTKMLIELGRDPLVIKETRMSTLYGLVNLMDVALIRAAKLKIPVLILYGEKDEIIPRQPTLKMIQGLSGQWRVALYKEGYHMLLRDLTAATVWQDIENWIKDPLAPLPSGSDKRNFRVLLGDDK